jgi:electron transfer flavoprotein beta subunit
VDEIAARPPREAGQIVTDEGDGGSKLVDYLAGAKLV